MNSPQRVESVVGRWEVIDNQGLTVPNSFFWFTMDYIEFREDGTAWALMHWPPDVGSDIRLNKITEYALGDKNQIEFTGACRHQDPCTGDYTADLNGDELLIFDSDGKLTLKWDSPASEEQPPPVPGPSASPTPATTQ